ncbi:MAG: hypothetical protein IV107_08315 [Paucibacter sp.]|nr:hypothetical protein [Roseateles sp.]
MLTETGNHFGGLATVVADDISLRDGGALTAAITASGSSTLQAGGALVVSGSGVGLSTTSASTTNFGASALSGNLVVNSTGAVTQSAALTVTGTTAITATGVDVTLAEAGNNFGGLATVAANNISLRDSGALMAVLTASGNSSLQSGAQLNLGGSTVGGNLSLTSAGALTQTSASALIVGGTTTVNAGGFDVTLAEAGNDFGAAVAATAKDISLRDSGALTLGGSSISGNLNVTSAGALTQTGATALMVTGTTTITASGVDVTLTEAGNDFGGLVTAVAKDISLRDSGALTVGLTASGNGRLQTGGTSTFGHSTLGGDLSVSSAGAVGQIASTALTVAGTSVITAGANTVTLTQAGNDFQGAVSVSSSQAVQLSDSNAITLGLLNTSQDLTVNAIGIGQNGAGITVGGNSHLNAGSGAIGLTTVANDFVGTVALSGALTAISDANALTLANLATGALTASSHGALNLGSGTAAAIVASSDGGAISQAGALSVAGASAINAGSGPIALTQADNDFQGPVALSGGAVLINSAHALTLSLSTSGNAGVTAGGSTIFGASTVGGDLLVSSGAAITQTSGSALRVGGNSTIVASGSDVSLLEAGNDFGGLLTVSGAQIGLRDSNALTLAGVTAATLSVTAAGNLSQTGALSVAGPAQLVSTGGAIKLDHAGNDFQAAVTASAAAAGQSLILVDANALTLSLAAGGNAEVTALTGPLNVSGSSGGSLKLASGSGIVLGATSVAQGLTASADGDIGQTAALTIGAASALKSTAGSLVLTLAANDFVGTLSATAAQDVSLVDANDLSLALSAGRAATVTATTGALDIAGSSGATLTTLSGLGSNFGPLTVGAGLSSRAGGDLTQAGAVKVMAAADLASTGASVLLSDAGNDFVGALSVTAARDVAVVDANALQLSLTAAGAGQATAGSLTISGSTGASLTTVSDTSTSLGLITAGGQLSASSAGAVTQTAAINAAGLELKGSGSFTLEHAGNQVASIAATSGGAADSAISMVTAHDLSVDGITRSGQVSLRTLSGDLTLKQGVNIGDANLTLRSTGRVSQTVGARIQAGGLELLDAATFALDATGNQVSKIAIGGGAGADGAVSYVNAAALQVGQVNASVGVKRSGNVALSNLTGALSLNEAVNTGPANLTLSSNGAVTQAAGKAITAAGLELKGSASFTLTEAGNNVAKLAAASGGVGDGALRYLDADGLSVDSVNSVGISRSGDVSLRNLIGDLTLAQSAQLAGQTLRLQASGGSVTQTGGSIAAAALGVRAAGGIALGQSNAVSASLAAHADSADLLFHNANGYAVGAVADDGSLFGGVNGVLAGSKNITLQTSAGTVTQAAGSNLTANGLLLQGAAAYSLSNPANNIAKFAATQGGASDGAIAYVDADGFELSEVAGQGVTRAGTVELSNAAGRLSLTPLAGSIVSLSGGAIGVASPQLVDGKTSLPVFTLGGNIALDKGALSLKALKAASIDVEMFGKYRSDIGIAKEVVLVDAVGRPVKILADVIVQSGGSIKIANEGRLNLLADLGGSASLQQAGNDFSGGLSANLAAVKAATAEEGPARSLLRVVGTTVNIAGDGVSADAAYFAADKLATVDAAVINVRMSYSNTLGTRSQMPSLLLDMAPNAFDGSVPNSFGAHPNANIRVKVGADGVQGQSEAGFVSVRPSSALEPARTQSLIGKRAAIFLSGPETGVAGYLFFYDGAGAQLEIPIYYNGYAPSSPQVEGALSSIASVSEAARRDRFEEAVRTENVAARLRGGVISEVGPGRPATSGSSGAAEAAGCEMVGGEAKESQLKCKI